jgi:DNA-binding transcriptional MerR regulator
MKISEAAKKCHLSTDTIRYYEKLGMLPEIKRGADGHRRFAQREIDWLILLYWLRETGMPLKQMQRFTTLAKKGNETMRDRRQILVDHAAELQRRRALIEKCEDVLAIKIASYQMSSQENAK